LPFNFPRFKSCKPLSAKFQTQNNEKVKKKKKKAKSFPSDSQLTDVPNVDGPIITTSRILLKAMHQESRTILDLYPHDILLIIISNSGANNLTKLMSCQSFMQQNRNFKRALDNVLINSKYIFYNYTTRPELTVGWDDDMNELEPSDFDSRESFELFDDYCATEGIETQIRITYGIYDIFDLVELEELLSRLRPCSDAMLQLHLELSTCRLLLLDLTRLLKIVTRLRKRIAGLTLEGEFATEIKGVINLDYFTNIKVLNIGGLSFCGSPRNCNSLTELTYLSTRFPMRLLDVGELPPSLKRFACDVGSFGLDSTLPDTGEYPRLESIHFRRCKSAAPEVIKDILWNMTCPRTSSIKFDRWFGQSVDEFVQLLSDVSRGNGFKLESLSLEGSLAFPLNIYPLMPTLEKLELRVANGLRLDGILSKIPVGLVKLHLSNCDAMREVDVDFSKLRCLKHLKLHHCNINDSIFHLMQFPESLEVLDLACNNIESLEGVLFPTRLVNLSLDLNRLRHIDDCSFPESLRKLNASGNRLESVCLLKSKGGKELSIESLFLESHPEISTHWELPKVRTLYLSQFKPYVGQYLGENLVNLVLMDCGDLCFNSIDFGNKPRIQYLFVHDCSLDGFDMSSLPELEEVKLSFMAKVPKGLGHLRRLRYLNITQSSIKKVSLEFHSRSLEVLDLSSNLIEKVQLTFPVGKTKLKRLSLSENELRDISLEDIGHKGLSRHESLCELGLSRNEALSGAPILKLIDQLSLATQSLWVNETAKTLYNCYDNNHLMRNVVEGNAS